LYGPKYFYNVAYKWRGWLY